MTAQIELNGIDKHYGVFHALKNVSLTIDKGSFVALVGPSGCGKSTLLRSIAGLETITAGELKIAGKTMTGVPPRHRDIAMVFQSYALYPHMTVEENLTYSLRLHGVGKAEAKAKAAEVAATTGLSQLLGRYPRQLSGGQRQRVAMGRAIIRNPKAFLFDEPLSNLDAALRVQMRKEIRALHDRLGATSVYVTHDQIEAMTMADWVVVMRDGIIEQQGRPLDLYDKPVNRFVAGFIGSPAMNFIDGRIAEAGRSVVLADGAGELPLARSLEPGRAVVVGMRPEHLQPAATDATFHLEIGVIESTGSATYLTSPDGAFQLVQSERSSLKPGDRIGLSIAPENIHLFDPQTGVAL
ncbi:MAG: sn-glycerol-3-phosphate ABC transporter ATP-binding protein UgpC [Devosia sp.]|jgi:multiple sugar transport system ATP-binding protein|uniref:ABC transporter ATP-binding protein n=1 Tax=Devosia sp. TaxID=1871048 RepID=UPI001A0BAB5F|nr:sn-glycerol-3-phosphate ABC transporter ATP-binding protein UgpC [Devosia sp.]MBF0680670.1 sn-glycerol-3-phosphate ABC transporter ATP-binding protein UgpC [Devosia sp.]